MGSSVAMILLLLTRNAHEPTGQEFMVHMGGVHIFDGCHQCHGVHISRSLTRVGRRAPLVGLVWCGLLTLHLARPVFCQRGKEPVGLQSGKLSV